MCEFKRSVPSVIFISSEKSKIVRTSDTTHAPPPPPLDNSHRLGILFFAHFISVFDIFEATTTTQCPRVRPSDVECGLFADSEFNCTRRPIPMQKTLNESVFKLLPVLSRAWQFSNAVLSIQPASSWYVDATADRTLFSNGP